MEGKTLFLKFNTGPSGHGGPAAAGEALALKRAGAAGVKVFVLEGEGGLTPGGVHETMNSAWGLALDNLYFLIDWNDFGIDDHPVSAAMHGTPADWFGAHGWRVVGTEQGMDWAPVTETLLAMTGGENPDRRPSVAWFKTRKGRGYLKYDNPVHGVPHKLNCEIFWETKRPFAEKYGVQFVNFGGPAPADPAALREEFEANLAAVIDVLRRDQALVDYLADRLVELGDSVPEEMPGFQLINRRGGVTPPLQPPAATPFEDERLYDFRNYPADLYVKPGASAANRAALAKWGAWVNAFGAQEYGRPLFMVASADLADSTNISGFAERYGDFPGYGWYERFGTADGVLLPQEITEFANAGILVGMATVNFAADPEKRFDGFWGACSTYGSFSYLKYGPMRLFSQLAQDCELQDRQGDLGRRPLRPGDGRGQPHALRHLLARRDPALPRRRDHQPAPVGIQRGAGAAGRGAAREGADRRPAPDPPAGHDPGSRGAGHPVALRGRARGLRPARSPARPTRRHA